jgi:hypothetical protein
MVYTNHWLWYLVFPFNTWAGICIKIVDQGYWLFWESNLKCGKIGNINCCAPTCADDVALIANNPFDIQTMVDIAVDFSKREGYLLQPQKCGNTNKHM